MSTASLQGDVSNITRFILSTCLTYASPGLDPQYCIKPCDVCTCNPNNWETRTRKSKDKEIINEIRTDMHARTCARVHTHTHTHKTTKKNFICMPRSSIPQRTKL